jgi:hypothetical protein
MRQPAALDDPFVVIDLGHFHCSRCTHGGTRPPLRAFRRDDFDQGTHGSVVPVQLAGTYLRPLRTRHAVRVSEKLRARIDPTFPRCRSLTVEFAPFQCSGQALAHRKQRRARAEPSFALCDRRLGRVWAGLVDHGRTSAAGIPHRRPPSCRERLGSEPIDPTHDLGEQGSGQRHLGQLEDDVASMAHDPGTDLDQLLAQRRERPLLNLLRQG